MTDGGPQQEDPEELHPDEVTDDSVLGMKYGLLNIGPNTFTEGPISISFHTEQQRDSINLGIKSSHKFWQVCFHISIKGPKGTFITSLLFIFQFF